MGLRVGVTVAGTIADLDTALWSSGVVQNAVFLALLLARLPEDDLTLAADRRQAVRLAAERAREASAAFRRDGADWDELRALGLPAAEIEPDDLDGGIRGQRRTFPAECVF